MPVSNDLDSVFTEAGNEWNVDPRLLKAMAQTESAGRTNARSKVGAGGLMQIMPDTARGLGVTNLDDPVQSIWGAAKYMAQALDAEKTPEDALRFYHGGPGWRNAYGPESRSYAPLVTAAYQKVGDPAAKPPAIASGASAVAATPKVDDTDDFLSGRTDAKPVQAAAKPGPDSIDDFLSGKGATPPPPSKTADDAIPTMTIKPETAETRRVGDLMVPGPPTASPDKTAAPPPSGVNIPGVSGPPKGFDLGEIGRAAGEGYTGGAVVTPAGIAAADKYGVGFLARGVNYLSQPLAGIANAGQDIAYQMGNALAPGLGRDVIAAQAALPMVMHGMPPAVDGNALAMGGKVARAGGEAAALERASPLSPEFKAAPTAPGYAGQPNPMLPGQTIQAGDLSIRLPPAEGATAVPAPSMPNPNLPTMAIRPDAPPTGQPPAPQSAGAAASRDTSALPLPDKSPTQKIADLEKSVTQTAEERAGPQLRDTTAYVKDIPPRLVASSEFTPANALDEKVAIASDPVFRAEVEKNTRDRNTGMVDLIRNDAQDANAMEAAHSARSEVSPNAMGVFKDEKPVDAASLKNKIQTLLAGPDGKQAAVRNTLNNVLQSLHDADGNLETMPSMVYGARKNLTDLLKKGVKGTGDMADDVRASKAILSGLLPDFDQTISAGAPKFSSEYLPQYHQLSQPINQMEFLQKYQTGAKKITDGDGYLVPAKVQKMLDDILQGQKAPGVNAAKALTDDQVQNIINVRNELFAGKLKDRMAAVKGSDSFQQINRAMTPVDSAAKTAIKAGGTMGAHALMAVSPAAGWGNAILGAYQGIVKPTLKARKAAKAETAIAARKNYLLQSPPPD